ncbi:hypothetical protein QBC32DRAFT_401298 [Pseudoneurospora amorphoporcata]|uniref:Aminoglycoside phosphotransferase domain-containing protein n=1 Tax=Pseudoneurospora amorphoporcata TaxID=241081 RepID=A0AAN6SBA3_9PEZI|nr:hypothetical protein QBC32DRAFT_401298 [Pseudoneurospora amorphoporcata]
MVTLAAARNYSQIDAFFNKTSASRKACVARAKELVGDVDGVVVPVDVQGMRSYTVYAGPELDIVVQFRMESLALNISLATAIYGSLRRNFMGDVAHFMALFWKAPQPFGLEYRSRLRETYVTDLKLLNNLLPSRFRHTIKTCIDAIDDILSLPMVLLHRDFGPCNIIVDEATCHLVGVINWAEAEVCPFGLNLHSLGFLSGKLHLSNGWTRYGDYHTLQDIFWERFKGEVGGLSGHQLQTIKIARALDVLLLSGFTSRLANEPKPVPITDDKQGHYNMMLLDGFLINPETRFEFDWQSYLYSRNASLPSSI